MKNKDALLVILMQWLLIGFLVGMWNIASAEASSMPDYTDDTRYSNFVGRLYIPDVGIDVALYRSNKQNVVDREDSAAYFSLSRWRGHMLIADHWTQGFATLKDVEVGMIAHIDHKDGTTTCFECVQAFNGHNTGKYITDWDYRNVVTWSDMLMYTCFDGWRNVKVTLWNEKPPEEMIQCEN